MKIGKETIAGLTQKNTAGGLRYYWEPNPKQRAAGWKTLALGMDASAAITGAKRRNDEIGQWQTGGAKPRQVKAFVKKASFGAVLDRYERDVLANKSANTQRVDKTAVARLRYWAGEHPFHWINRARVRALRDGMMAAATIDGPGHAPAFHLLTTLRKICGWWINEADLKVPNPAADFALPAPAPRFQIWDQDAQAAFLEAADALGRHSIALAFVLAKYIGQREADILAVDRSRWREIGLQQLDGDHALYAALAGSTGPDAGKVMGIHVQQQKTRVWVGVPIEGDMRAMIEAAIAADVARDRDAAALRRRPLIVNESTGRKWGQSDFIHTFGEIRDSAWAVAIIRGDDDLAERLADLQFRDLRRTCIVTLGQLGLNDYTIGSISGHKQETIKKILEVYMPRTIAAAGRGVVARIGIGNHAGLGVEKRSSERS
jgi:hypothetical protein